MRPFALAAFLALCLPSSPGHAAASYDNCTSFIDTLPAVISTQGVWCLRRDVSTSITSGAAITINVNNATLDCNDFKIGGLGAGLETEASGVRASNRLNTTIRNCNIRGFNIGVQLINQTSGNLVEDSRFEANTYAGVYLVGGNSMVRNNQLIDTGGAPDGFATYAIFASGDGISVLDNTVTGVIAGGPDTAVQGIYTANAVVVGRNRVSGLDTETNGSITGIRSYAGMAAIHDNVVSGDPLTPAGSGIRCASELGVAKGNIVQGFGLPVAGCTISGNVTVVN